MVVTQRYAEPPAYIRKPYRVDLPLRARKLDRTDVGKRRRLDTASHAAGTENASVESHVVNGDEVGTVKPGPEGRPELSEGWCAAHVFPCESMASGKREDRRRRPDEIVADDMDLAVPSGCHTHRAGTAPVMAGGFEVERDERSHGGSRLWCDGFGRGRGLNFNCYAPLAGGDVDRLGASNGVHGCDPRPPRGRRHPDSTVMPMANPLRSTPPSREATPVRWRRRCDGSGCDPRPPRGRRHSRLLSGREVQSCDPRPPRGRRHLGHRLIFPRLFVAIHAPLAGGDFKP